MENDEIKTKIVEALEPEELRELRQELEDKKQELEELGDWEIEDNAVDDYLDDIYGEVDLAGINYYFSRVLKDTDECRWEDFKTDIEYQKREELEEELQDEINDLEEQIDNYE